MSPVAVKQRPCWKRKARKQQGLHWDGWEALASVTVWVSYTGLLRAWLALAKPISSVKLLLSEFYYFNSAFGFCNADCNRKNAVFSSA